MPRTMSDKQKRAINRGRKRAGLKPIRFKSSVGKTEKRYVIIRMYRDPARRSRIIKRNLTLAQAKKHTNDPKTMKKGVWFDGFDIQRPNV